MAILFKKVRKINPQKLNAPKKWHPAIKTVGTLTEKEVAQRIADEITLNPKEAEMTIYQLEKVLVAGLLDSKTITLGELGSFYLTLRSKGVDSKDDVSVNQIENIMIHFRPSESLRKKLANATFVSIENLVYNPQK